MSVPDILYFESFSQIVFTLLVVTPGDGCPVMRSVYIPCAFSCRKCLATCIRKLMSKRPAQLVCLLSQVRSLLADSISSSRNCTHVWVMLAHRDTWLPRMKVLAECPECRWNCWRELPDALILRDKIVKY